MIHSKRMVSFWVFLLLYLNRIVILIATLSRLIQREKCIEKPFEWIGCGFSSLVCYHFLDFFLVSSFLLTIKLQSIRKQRACIECIEISLIMFFFLLIELMQQCTNAYLIIKWPFQEPNAFFSNSTEPKKNALILFRFRLFHIIFSRIITALDLGEISAHTAMTVLYHYMTAHNARLNFSLFWLDPFTASDKQ